MKSSGEKVLIAHLLNPKIYSRLSSGRET